MSRHRPYRGRFLIWKPGWACDCVSAVGKAFRLTDKGEIVYSASQKLFASLEHFGEVVDGTRAKLVGRLSVAAIDNWAFNDDAPIVGALGELTRIASRCFGRSAFPCARRHRDSGSGRAGFRGRRCVSQAQARIDL